MRQLSVFALMLVALVSGLSCGPSVESKAPGISKADPMAAGDTASGEAVPGEKVLVTFETSQGKIVLELYPEWSPLGVQRVQELVEAGFYDECRFFRVVPDFMVQFGINGNPEMNAKWADKNLRDEPVKVSNRPGYVTFAKTGAPNSRSTQLFINYGDNAGLDRQGFSPIGKVVEGMDIALKINAQYGESPDQGQMKYDGNAYLQAQFPKLDYIVKASIGRVAASPLDQPAAGDTAKPEGSESEK